MCRRRSRSPRSAAARRHAPTHRPASARWALRTAQGRNYKPAYKPKSAAQLEKEGAIEIQKRVRSALVGEDEPVARPVSPATVDASGCEGQPLGLGAAGRQLCHEFGHGIAQIHEAPAPPSFVTLDCPHTPSCVHRVSRMPQIWAESLWDTHDA